jgi:tetratricopeptide (TPR) repeat protein
MDAMRRLFWCQLFLLLVAGMAAAQPGNPNQQSQSPNPPADRSTPAGAETPAAETPVKPEITVTGKRPTERPLPPLPPDQFTNCMSRVGSDADFRNPGAFYVQLTLCEHQLNMERHVVIERCLNRDENTAPPSIIQACTESLDHQILQGSARYFLFVNRAEAYFALGDAQHALGDYNEAIRLAPRNASLYYNRGIFFAAQANGEDALRDFDTAIGIDPKLAPALWQRAKIYEARGDFGEAIADFSEAIRLQPKTAALWSERGLVCLRQHSYESALKDEDEAIRLDPKLARAYFLRGAAYGDLGDSRSAVGDLMKAVDLDPSLDRYIASKGKSASITLPP